MSDFAGIDLYCPRRPASKRPGLRVHRVHRWGRRWAWYGLLLAAVGCARESAPVATPAQASQAKVRFDRDLLLQSLESLGLGGAADSVAIRRVREDLGELPFGLPDEVMLVFALENRRGRALSVRGPGLDSTLRWLDAAQARAAYDSLRSAGDWRPNWIPILRSSDRWWAVEASRGTSPAGPVIEVSDSGAARFYGTNLSVLTAAWAESASARAD